MTRVAVIAQGAISATGVGAAATGAGEPGQPARSAIAVDAALAAAGLARPNAARVAGDPGAEDRAAWLLGRAFAELTAELDQVRPGWREAPVGLALGTSSGGMESQVRAFRCRAAGEAIPRALARAAPYFGPLAVVPRFVPDGPAAGAAGAGGVPAAPRAHVLAACASSVVALGLACRWLDQGRAPLVIAGGYDALTGFVAAGFEALGATTASLPAPFRAVRDGMALGEGAALLALVREPGAARVYGWLTGFGASSDAEHATAPNREGRGLASAAARALGEAGLGAVDLVSAHGTATPFNDAAEARALATALGAAAPLAVVVPTKAVLGHTLGAAGALETLTALDALRRGVLPAALGAGPTEPALTARLLDRAEAGAPRTALKLAAAFGGANAALTLARDAPPPAPPARAQATAVLAAGPRVAAPLEGASPPGLRLPAAQLARLEAPSALAVAAVAALLEATGLTLGEDTGVVVGSATASLDVNDAFDARCRERGLRQAPPRLFPPTSPNLAPGQVAQAFGLRGPNLAVGWGPSPEAEALDVAHTLVAAGDAPCVLVVAVEAAGAASRELFRAAGWPEPAPGAQAFLVGLADAAGPGGA